MSKLYGKRLTKKQLLKKLNHTQEQLDAMWFRHNRLLEHLKLDEVTYPSETKLEKKPQP